MPDFHDSLAIFRGALKNEMTKMGVNFSPITPKSIAIIGTKDKSIVSISSIVDTDAEIHFDKGMFTRFDYKTFPDKEPLTSRSGLVLENVEYYFKKNDDSTVIIAVSFPKNGKRELFLRFLPSEAIPPKLIGIVQ